MPTVREIAEYAGVSKSTVSLVMNDKPGVSEQMRETVLSAVAALETQESDDTRPAAQTNDALTVVVLHPPVLRSSYVFAEILEGIQDGAKNFNLQLRLVANEPQAGAGHVANLYFSTPSLQPDGVLIFGAQQHEPLLEQAKQLDIPCVVLGRDVSRYAVSGIGRREAQWSYRATQYLLKMGHRRVGFVGGDEAYDFVHNRLEGYQHALEDAGIMPQDAWVQLGAGDAATERLLTTHDDITGLLFVNDSFAAEGLPVLADAGLHIPDDISVISFDDTDIARVYSPPLTSVSYNRHKEGQWAIKMLIEHIRFPFLDAIHTFFDADFIERDSCAPPRN